jgi:hypothetical protein
MRFSLRYTLSYVLLLLILKINVAAQGESVNSIKLAGIQFAKNSKRLSTNSKNALDSIIYKMKKFDSCKIEIHVGDDGCFPHNKSTATAWNRVNRVVSYLIKKGWDEQRILFRFASGIDNNIVEVYKGGTDKQSKELSPHPVLKKRIINPHLVPTGI